MEANYERSYCNQALIDAGLDLTPEPTGIRYTSDEIARMARGYKLGRMNVRSRRGPAIGGYSRKVPRTVNRTYEPHIGRTAMG